VVAVRVLLDAQATDVELDSSFLLLQEMRNKKRDIDRKRNNPTGFRKCFTKYFLFIEK
jgi:hypothetical protein